MLMLRSLYAANDAPRMAARLYRDYLRFLPDSNPLRRAAPCTGPEMTAALHRAATAFADTGSPDRIQGVVLVDEAATLQHLQTAFGQLIVKARASDVVVFAFGGISANNSDSSRGPSEHFMLLGGVNMDDDQVVWSGSLSTRLLANWMNSVVAKWQLVLVDAGRMSEFLPDLLANLVESDPTAARLTTRDRFILGPREYGGDITSQHSGVLAYRMERADRSVLEAFVAPAAVQRSLEEAFDPENQVRIFSEREFLTVYAGVSARLAARTASASRGFGTVRQEAPPPSRVGGRNIAVIVGTNEYLGAPEWRPLVNPAVDAQAVAEELSRNYGFETKLLINPLRGTVLDTLRALADVKFEQYDQLLVFIAGHGLYDEKMKMGYVVTRDSKRPPDDRYFETYLNHNTLAQYLDAIPSKHTLLILDVCFGGAFSDLMSAGARAEADVYTDRPLGDFIRERLRYKSRFYLASGGTEYVSDGRPGEHSPFARRFIGALRDHAHEGRPLTMSALQAAVELAKPTPRYGEFGSTEPGGDFLFIPASLQH